MTQADKIRRFTFSTYIQPARAVGKTTVTIRAGDVHDALGLKQRHPAVTGAIGTEKFERAYNVSLVKREGPTSGADVHFTFRV